MNTTTFHKIRLLFEAELDPEKGTGELTAGELGTLKALYHTLADDDEYDTESYFLGLKERLQTEAGLLDRFQLAVQLLNKTAQQKYSRNFEGMSRSHQNDVLKKILSGSVSRLAESPLKNRLKMTRWHFEKVFSTPARRSFRQFVSTDMLTDYYRGVKGWALVGYEEFPGRVRGEWEPCEVLRVHFEHDDILLELSDLTFDKLLPEALHLEGEDSLVAVTKYGRQRATFSRTAYNTLTEYLESEEDDLFIRRGDRTWKIGMS